MEKTVKYKSHSYKINLLGVKIKFRDNVSEIYEHRFFTNSRNPLQRATPEQVESFLDYIIEAGEKQKKITEDWHNNLKNYTEPSFQKEDYLILKLSYATVLYQVDKIKKDKNGYLTYVLKGKRILNDNGTNPHKTEAKQYEPYCAMLDKELSAIPVAKEGLMELLTQGQAI